MNLNEKQLGRIVKCLSNNNQRNIIKFLQNDNVLTYSDMRKRVSYDDDKSGKFAYNIRMLVKMGIIKKERKGYFLTRVGVQLARLLSDFEQVCMSYDISDLDADGKIEMVVRR